MVNSSNLVVRSGSGKKRGKSAAWGRVGGQPTRFAISSIRQAVLGAERHPAI
ncbi:hypothetical protein [Nocardia asiatica]|uniref:hypothetical protein n=1 Tax=Nocardia asiatica TaxID=209252 RepID=UPI0002EA871E|nr:hypothetical protein [Nocardia asiatica]